MTADVIPLNNYDRQVARLVKLAIFDSGKSQKEVAAAAGIGPSSMTYRMNGTRPWRVEEIVLIARATGVSVTDLLPRMDSNHQPFDIHQDYLPLWHPSMGPQVVQLDAERARRRAS